MKKPTKAPAKTARKAAAAKPAPKKAKTSAAPKATAAPKAPPAPKSAPAAKSAAAPKPAPAPKAAPAAKVGWSEAIRNALKEKQSGRGPGGGNVWSGKQRAGSKDPQTLRRGRTD